MKRILVFTKTDHQNEVLRRDINSILTALSDNFKIEIYDIRKALLIDFSGRHQTSFSIPTGRLLGKLYPLFNMLSLIWLLMKSRKKYDFIQVNYVRHELIILWPLLAATGAKISLFFYGSDFNQRDWIKNNFTGLFKISRSINFTNPQMVERFNRQYKNRFIEKVSVIDLPFDHFKFYDDFAYETKADTKIEMGVDPNKFVIAVGTNALANEQHETIIATLKKIAHPERYHLIFVLSHANTAHERSLMLQGIIKSDLHAFSKHVFSHFLSYEELARIRHASDCLLNFRLIDQMTLSMLESNLAFCSVITGSWLPYNYYLSLTNTTVVNSIELVNTEIERLYHERNTEAYQKKLLHNRSSIQKRFNFQTALVQWHNLFKSE